MSGLRAAFGGRTRARARRPPRVTDGGLSERLSSWSNLLLAYTKAARGKRGRPDVAAFEHDLEGNLLDLAEALAARAYRPGAYHSFVIREPKRRIISAAPFRDRVVHHALCNLIEPLFERGFLPDSFANRVGYGTHRALDRLQALMRRFPYALQLDVRQFFPSIDHEILRSLLARKLAGTGVLWLVDRILESGRGVLDDAYDPVCFPGDDLFWLSRPRGLPIGNLTSQFWANVYLNPVDHFVRRSLGCGAYVRYVDDMVLLGRSKSMLWQWKEAVERRLHAIRLTIHPGAHPRPVGEGIPFLGFVTWPRRRRVKARKVVEFRRRLRALLGTAPAAGAVPPALAASLHGWMEHVRRANTVGLQRVVREAVAVAGRRIPD